MIRSCCATQTSSPTHFCVLHGFSSRRSGASVLGHLPRPRMGSVTDFLRSVRPPSQAMVHGVQSLHCESLQSRSQEPVWQGRDSCTASHFWPPFLGLLTTDRDLTWTPLSQSLVHLDQPDHADIWQFLSHLRWAHFFCLSNAGHLMPNSLGATTSSLFIISLPPHLYGSFGSGQASSHVIVSPLGFMHWPSLGTQSETSQSLTLFGGDFELAVNTSSRTLRTAHIFVKRISDIVALNFATFSS
mmetsp:Transcript_26061/g.82396  ORF Transcript_26061/g.82396 Transcript_26061/m.82396 type:complete len:243 (+) Transcript_26061:1025-1753(+)